ncbi:MAG: hypothetical protein V2J20_03195 [Wenzhouxiangella sp.]|nr:hypothetical protein [Wenzhouxiangella sp.]
MDRPANWSTAQFDLADIETRTLPSLDVQKLMAEDAAAQDFGQPPRFAIAEPVFESTADIAGWTDFGRSSSWRIRIQAPDAVSLNFAFRKVHLVEGALLWVYPADLAEKGVLDPAKVLGPYGPEINKPHGEFWTPVLPSNDVIIELEVPSELRDQVSLEIAQANQGYRGFSDAPDSDPEKNQTGCGKGISGAKSGSCNMDVTCLGPADPWNEPRRAVARYTVQGTSLCTGSLINNTANDRRMLFATASHCGISSTNAASIVAYWNYEWPSCRTPGTAAGTQVRPPDPSQTSSGATLIAATNNPFDPIVCSDPGTCSDFTLLELDGPANPDFNLYWAGWDRRSTPAACGPQGAPGSTDGLCASIHHPSGDEKRITFVESDLVQGSIDFAQDVHWRAFWHPDPPVLEGIPAPQPASIPPGVTEPGSSGAPLFSADRRLVGVLSGGPAFCGATGAALSDLYGQLAHAWNGIGTPTTRVRDALDPLNLGAAFIDGIDATPFQIEASTESVQACTLDGSVAIGFNVSADQGFASPISFSVSDAPTGASTSFSPNPLTPPGTTTLTIGNLGSAATGSNRLFIEGQSGDNTDSAFVNFHLANDEPTPAIPTAPADGAIVDDSGVTFSWTGASGAAGVRIQVATDFSFRQIVRDQLVRGASSVTVNLPSRAQYFWRAIPENGCAIADASPTRSFIIAAQSGQCPIGTQEVAFWSDDMESGTNGWTLGTGSTQNTWAQITSDSVSGNTSWRAINVDSISDQRLISPSIDLPDISPLVLRFQNRQEIEGATGGCFDGALLEISTDNGNSWSLLEGNRIGFREHDGQISADFGNPAAGENAWCGDPRDWEDYAIDLSDFAGQTIRLRYRLTTDGSVGGRDGWLIDDVRVVGCGGVDTGSPISGNWFNLSRDGEGCQLTREADEQTYILTCYVYQGGEQVWLIGTGELDDSRIQIDDMLITSGADYGSNFNPSDVIRTLFGPVEMEFDDCNNGRVLMNPSVAGFEDVVLPMRKIVEASCDRGLPDPVNAAHTGNWYNPARDGEGFQLAVEGSSGLHVITYYTYLNGEQVWLIGTGTIEDDVISFEDMIITSGAGFGSAFDKDDVVRTPFGTLTLEFTDCNNATIDIDSILPEFPDQQIALQRIVTGACPD